MLSEKAADRMDTKTRPIYMLYKEDVVHTHTHTHTNRLEYYSATKRNKIMPFAAPWMGPRDTK